MPRAFIKAKLGEPVVLSVISIGDGKDGYQHDEWKFIGRTAEHPDACVSMLADTAERQLTRNGLTRETAIGRTLEFAAVKQGVKTFYDINIAGAEQGTMGLGAERTTPTPGAPARPSARTPLTAEQKKARLDRDLALYEWCFKHVSDTRAKNEDSWPITHEGLALEAQTLFQHFTRRGAQ